MNKIKTISIFCCAFIALTIISCTTTNDAVVIIPTDLTPVTDVDGNVYPIVIIGTQTWMAENLKTVRYRNGDSISNLKDSAKLAAATAGAWCNYVNDTANNRICGKLYNWYAVNDTRNIAPKGWHVATDAEWTTLTSYLAKHYGHSLNLAKALADTSMLWNTTTDVGTIGDSLQINNSSGFKARPGGYRSFENANFDKWGDCGYWWCATEYGSNGAHYRRLQNRLGFINEGYSTKSFGFSVRCVKDTK
jgi:uncharacterized protein (TIGR02145 family)